MVLGAWLILAGVCVVFVALGVWAIAQIFPIKPVATRRSRARSSEVSHRATEPIEQPQKREWQ